MITYKLPELEQCKQLLTHECRDILKCIQSASTNLAQECNSSSVLRGARHNNSAAVSSLLHTCVVDAIKDESVHHNNWEVIDTNGLNTLLIYDYDRRAKADSKSAAVALRFNKLNEERRPYLNDTKQTRAFQNYASEQLSLFPNTAKLYCGWVTPFSSDQVKSVWVVCLAGDRVHWCFNLSSGEGTEFAGLGFVDNEQQSAPDEVLVKTRGAQESEVVISL